MSNKKISELPYIDETKISGNTLVPLVTYFSAVTGDTVHTFVSDLQNYLVNGITGSTIGGDYLPLSGGTVTGSTTFTNGLSANTISATTYQNLPVSGLTAGSNINISGSNGNFTISVTGVTGGTFTGGTVTGPTTFTSGLSANTISATTYQNLPISGLTAGSNISLTNNNNNYTIAVTGVTFTGGTSTGGTVIISAITANTIYTDYIDFNTGATVAQSIGRINWDSGTGTLNVTVGDAGTGLIDLQVGQEEIVRVYNDEVTTLLKGEIVYVSGSQGNRPKVKRAIATSDGYSVTTLGMVDRNISSGSEGYVTTFGVISNLNTLGLSGGTPIWLSPTVAGGYTTTKPIAPYHTVLIGYVIRVSATVGSIFINISNGWELDELHDVRISASTEGDLLVRSSYSGSPVWINTKTLPGNYTISGNTTLIGNLSATTTQTNTLIIQNPYVPTGSTDPTGTVGTISWSGNTIYLRNSTEWVRFTGETSW